MKTMKTEKLFDIRSIESNREIAASVIAQSLRLGSLALAVGAGASAGLGLPLWYELVQRCLDKAAIKEKVSKDTPSTNLRFLVDRVETTLGSNYLTTVRDALYERTGASAVLTFPDFKDLPALTARFRNDNHPLVRLLRGQFSPSTQTLLENSMLTSDHLQSVVLVELNRILRDTSLYSDPTLFEGVVLSEETRGAIQHGATGFRLNRLLLEDTFPTEMSRNRYSVVLKQDLLLSLGALLMGSRRGSIAEVLNFNFDNMLQWYLGLHGFTTQIVTEFPMLRKDVDVTVFHPHGYLPKDSPSSEFSKKLTFSQYSYDETIAHFESDLRVVQTVQILRSKEILFIGLSGNDPIFGPLLVKVVPEIGRSRYTGYWFFGPGVDPQVIDAVRSRNVVPLKFDSFQEISEFLLTVCQEAAIL
jgi:hypothetical protein